MKKILFILFLIIPFLGFSQHNIEVDLSNPNTTIYTHLFFLQDDSYFPKKAALTIYGYEGQEAVEKAIKLKGIMDGKGLLVDFTEISVDPDYIDSTGGYENKNRFVLFPLRMPEISVSKYEGKWYYSEETIEKIDELYSQTFAWNMDWLKTIVPASFVSTKFFKIKLWQYLGLLIILIAGSILFFIISRIVYLILKKIKNKFYKNVIPDSTDKTHLSLKKLSRPITLLIVLTMIVKILPSLHLDLNVNAYIFFVLNVAKTIFWIYLFLKVVQVFMSIYTAYVARTHARLDDQLVPVLNIFLTGVVVLLGVFRLLLILGIDVEAVIMGASIGGLALALASQDTVKNLLGTVMIFFDKPFHIGDWIEAGSVVGTVEQVGFRSSRIRAADTSVYQIPNSQLSEIAINNKGMRNYRRYTTTLGVRYDTPPELIDAFVKGLEELIKAHPHINSTNFKVAFSGFGASSLDIMLNVYFEILDWGAVQTSKHYFHLAIIRLAKVLKVEFAFPSTTMYMEQQPGQQTFQIDYDTNEDILKSSMLKVVNDFKTTVDKLGMERQSFNDEEE